MPTKRRLTAALPTGFIHNTSTPPAAEGAADSGLEGASLHITLGLETAAVSLLQAIPRPQRPLPLGHCRSAAALAHSDGNCRIGRRRIRVAGVPSPQERMLLCATSLAGAQQRTPSGVLQRITELIGSAKFQLKNPAARCFSRAHCLASHCLGMHPIHSGLCLRGRSAPALGSTFLGRHSPPGELEARLAELIQRVAVSGHSQVGDRSPPKQRFTTAAA